MPLRTFIFICYRRDDSGGQTGRLFDRLTEHFGEDQVFMDIDHIQPGQDFVKVIEEAVGSCWLLLAVMGKDWLGPAGADGHRRLDDPEDYVRLEIAAALGRDIPVIPVMVQGARMPRSNELPQPIAPLARRQTVELDDARWRDDVWRLIKALESHHAKFTEALGAEVGAGAVAEAARKAGLHVITTPYSGVFYRAPSPAAEPFVSVGYHVAPDTTVGIIKAMEVLSEIYADVAGTVKEIHVEDGQDVEKGQPLFGVEKD